jgi:hypothetical protein
LDGSDLRRLHPAIVLKPTARYLFKDHADFATEKPGLRRPLTTAFLPTGRLVVGDVSTKDAIGRTMFAPAVLELLKAEDGDDGQLKDFVLKAFEDERKDKPSFNKYAANVSVTLDRRTLAVRDESRVSFFDPHSLVSNSSYPSNLATDYRSEDRKKVGEIGGDIGVIIYVLTFSFRKSRSSPPKNKPFSHEMRLKIPFLA